jgi:hypothetical protein
MQQQQVMERMHDPEFAQRFAPKFNTDENSSSTSNNQNTNKNAFANNEEAINTKNSQNNISNTQENFSKNNSNDTNQNIKVGATAQNSFDSKDNTNSVNKLDKKENINSSESNKNNAFNQSNQANQQIPNNAINKFKDSVGTLGKATKALLDNDFNLKKANQHLDEKIQKGETQINKALMSATNANQERLWDKIYSGKAPSYSEEAKQYIQHGNDLKNKPSYAQKYSDYVEQRRQEYHEQIQNSILPNNEDINPKQQDNQIDKGKNEE